jgi:hypothetical protein
MPKSIDDLIPEAREFRRQTIFNGANWKKPLPAIQTELIQCWSNCPKPGVYGVWHRIAGLRVSGDINLAFPWGD